MIFFLIIGIALGAVSVIFILQNISAVTVTFLHWHMEGSLALVLFLTLISGMVITLLVLLPSVVRGDYYVSGINRRNKELEDELAKVKAELFEAKAKKENAAPQQVG